MWISGNGAGVGELARHPAVKVLGDAETAFEVFQFLFLAFRSVLERGLPVHESDFAGTKLRTPLVEFGGSGPDKFVMLGARGDEVGLGLFSRGLGVLELLDREVGPRR